MLSPDIWLLSDVVDHQRWLTAWTLLAAAGIALLFARGAALQFAGGLLIASRLIFAPMFMSDWLLLGAILGIGVAASLLAPSRAPASVEPGASDSESVPEYDDLSEPAPCPACRGMIPAGRARCPACGWTYAAQER